MRPFTSAYHFWAIYRIWPSCISALWYEGWRQILATSPDPETYSHPSLCLATALLHAGRSLHLMGGTSRGVTRSDTPFTENPRALLSSLFASPCSPQIYQLQMGILGGYCQTKQAAQWFPVVLPYQVGFLPSCVGALCTASQTYQEGQWPLLVSNFKAFHSRLPWQTLPQNISSLRCKHRVASFAYFLPLFHIHSAPITTAVSSPFCYNEHANFKQPTVSFLTAYTKAIQKD